MHKISQSLKPLLWLVIILIYSNKVISLVSIICTVNANMQCAIKF